MVPASCARIIRMTLWPRYREFDTFLDSTFHPHTVGEASVGRLEARGALERNRVRTISRRVRNYET